MQAARYTAPAVFPVRRMTPAAGSFGRRSRILRGCDVNSTSERKAFPIADVLSVVTGRLLVEDIGRVYGILNWMTGESLFTHQLPRVGREAEPAILAAHPELAEAVAEAEAVTPESWRTWLATWTERYGAELTIPKLTADQHERIGPVPELAETVHPDNIIVVSP